MMKNRLGKTLMILGAVLVLAALSLWSYNRMEEVNAKKTADALLPQLVEQIQEKQATETIPPETEIAESSEPSSTDATKPGIMDHPVEVIPTFPPPVDPTMTEVEIDGYAYIGYLTIQKLGLQLPVMADWDYPRLKVAPCRYMGSTKTDDLVIMAHNYNCHFGTLSELTEGDLVQFVDMDGTIWQYQVVAMDVLVPTAVEEVTSGDFDLTLFTCTYGGKTRVTVYCDLVKN